MKRKTWIAVSGAIAALALTAGCEPQSDRDVGTITMKGESWNVVETSDYDNSDRHLEVHDGGVFRRCVPNTMQGCHLVVEEYNKNFYGDGGDGGGDGGGQP